MATVFTAAEPSGPHTDVVRREIRAAAVVLAAVVVVSAVAGVVWAYLAPTERLLVVEPDRGAVLSGESAHQFDAVAVFVLIGIVTGLLTAAAAWRWRRVRGPILLAGLLLGSLVGAFTMSLVGEAAAELLYPRPHQPPVDSIVELAPTMRAWPAFIAQPLTAAVVMVVLIALSVADDLGSGQYRPFGGGKPRRSMLAPGPYGSAISYGPYGGPGANSGTAQAFGPGPYEGAGPIGPPR
ncbi:DUF2567 domain-containing protein [Nocardia uniformis]|uniref:DUF2567 domain-containing protein n=1 Tax=Nocardia uniformis TaxID=53432 RepID=A0A849C6Q4_9NOCA|nr:DUF2567 domain-containing protein [Nocardia uniformis]NNH72090.1 DUF2567 domain-containing protein [Nocardia uniformis]